ncbi:DNA-binding HxlR family transcriptional regulator [Paenarthrobacter nitroguajacolicus]|uniref:winged helix-turn-helix transcriptional regulator n=1 Tax=Paenarthrobacter TaxID=1742992 RepID=UPI0028653A7C|nr:helix-turn-helix domain-containing protein [Paenarthrobacter nitroguajacolicus]MDR6989663.1 DNA-binding HxlR family transcriptional regulator [Paenarthrobacter nitroguajacolicus]
MLQPSHIEWTDPECPVARAADLVGDKWTLLIIRDSLDGKRRFSEFEKSLGVAKNILSDRLRLLVERGILTRIPNERGTRSEYELTDAGRDLFTLMLSLRQWGERNAFDAGEQHSVVIDPATGEPVPHVRPLREDGTELHQEQTRLVKVGQPLTENAK